jgi:hypothetical protein
MKRFLFMGALTILLTRGAPAEDPILHKLNGTIYLACHPALIVFPPGVTTVEFNYNGINTDSLLGQPLDLALITAGFSYGDSTSFPYERPDIAGFTINHTTFTDYLLRWRVSRIAWMGPCSSDSVAKVLKAFGKKDSPADATSQAFRIYFPDIDRTENAYYGLNGLRGLRWAGYNRKYREQIKQFELSRP